MAARCRVALRSWHSVSRQLGLRPLRGFATVRISPERLEEFVHAELNVFARRTDRPLKPLEFQEILRMSGTHEALALLVHEELPVRFARRLKHIERLADWQRIPQLVALHDMHVKSFRELRLADPGDVEAYPSTIRRIRQRHKSIAPLFAGALAHIHEASAASINSCELAEDGGVPDRDSLEEWAEAFFNSRVSTEIQMSHYVAQVDAFSIEGAVADPTKVGILDTRCDPGEICRMAVDTLPEGGLALPVEIENSCGHIEFCHAPRYLFYIVVELLKNSARASLKATERDGMPLAQRPLRLAVCADDRQVVIRVSDRAGGFQRAGDMWSFLFTTDSEEYLASMQAELQASSVVEHPCPGLADRQVPWGVFRGQSPIAGRGIGIPLSRLYAMYLGGSLEVMNLPGLGVDAYLLLNRISIDA